MLLNMLALKKIYLYSTSKNMEVFPFPTLKFILPEE